VQSSTQAAEIQPTTGTYAIYTNRDEAHREIGQQQYKSANFFRVLWIMRDKAARIPGRWRYRNTSVLQYSPHATEPWMTWEEAVVQR
jgi:hypothetical protein